MSNSCNYWNICFSGTVFDNSGSPDPKPPDLFSVRFPFIVCIILCMRKLIGGSKCLNSCNYYDNLLAPKPQGLFPVRFPFTVCIILCMRK